MDSKGQQALTALVGLRLPRVNGPSLVKLVRSRTDISNLQVIPLIRLFLSGLRVEISNMVAASRSDCLTVGSSYLGHYPCYLPVPCAVRQVSATLYDTYFWLNYLALCQICY